MQKSHKSGYPLVEGLTMSIARKIAKSIPGLRTSWRFVKRLYELYKADRENPQYFLNGHFYSTIPSLKEIEQDSQRIFSTPSPIMQHIQHDHALQQRLLDEMAICYPEIPFPREKTDGFRYCYNNPSFPPCDAVMLYGMIRSLKPKRWIEVGCGYSSAVTLDTNEKFLGSSMKSTFIDPYPQLLQSLLKPGDHVEIIGKRIQDVDAKIFEELEAGDVLFVDTSHVVKTGSDVHHILFNILPRLKDGVYIHFHDIHHPFEWPREWLIPSGYPGNNEMGGTTWNEPYFLQAFLAYNTKFKIIFFETEITTLQKEYLIKKMPLCTERASGSIWIQKI